MIQKRDFLWNMIGGLVQSCFMLALSIVITRVNGIEENGIFQIAYATAIILYALGEYGMRVYHATDTKHEYSFKTYLAARVFVNIAMVIIGAGVIMISGYRSIKAAMCLAIILFKAVEGVSETYQAEFQLNDRLDLGGKAVAYRNMGAILLFVLVDAATGNILLSFAVLPVSSIIIFIFFELAKMKSFDTSAKADMGHVKELLLKCFPLFYSTLLNLYIINAAKYAIEKWMTDYEQAYYGYISMPTFVINLMSLFVLKPLLKPIGVLCEKEDYKGLDKLVLKLSGVIALLTLAAEAVCFFIGIPILELIYGVKLGSYKTEFLCLMLSGGFNALSVMFFHVIASLRCKAEPFIAYTATFIFAFFICSWMVEKYGLFGAGISSILTMAMLSIILMIAYIHKIRSKEKT